MPQALNPMEIVLAIIQALTLIVLAFYAIQTWRTVREMRESRAQEIAPYVVPYFDIPHGKEFIYFVVKNVGRGVAENVRFEFDPPLADSHGRKVSEIPMIRNGIPSIPPGYEIRTFFDTALSVFGEEATNLPLTYEVKVTYSGGIVDQPKTTKVVLDLSAFKGLSYLVEKGTDKLVEQVEKLVHNNEKGIRELEKIAGQIADGVWLKNPDFLLTGRPVEPGAWRSEIMAKLTEFRMFWTSIYSSAQEKRMYLSRRWLENWSASLAAQILILTSATPTDVPTEVKDQLLEIVSKLSEIARPEFSIVGRPSVRIFDRLGGEIVNVIDRIAEQLGQSSPAVDQIPHTADSPEL